MARLPHTSHAFLMLLLLPSMLGTDCVHGEGGNFRGAYEGAAAAALEASSRSGSGFRDAVTAQDMVLPKPSGLDRKLEGTSYQVPSYGNTKPLAMDKAKQRFVQHEES